MDASDRLKRVNAGEALASAAAQFKRWHKTTCLEKPGETMRETRSENDNRHLQFPIWALFVATISAAIIIRVIMVLGWSSCFYLTPLLAVLVGAISGRRFKQPFFGAAVVFALIAIYGTTLPMVERVWPHRYYSGFVWYSFPFYKWTECVDWIWFPFCTWEIFCRVDPACAAFLLLIGLITLAYVSLRLDQLFAQRRSKSNRDDH